MEEILPEIIRRCQNGSTEEFATVMETYERPVFSYVYKILYKTHKSLEVEDAVQEIFLKAYTKIHTFRSDMGAKFSHWLFTIARNHCLSLLRKRGIVTRSMQEEEETRYHALADPKSKTPEEVALQKELAEKVASAVSKLPEDQKSAFILRHYEDLSYEDIAAIMSCNIGTAKSRVARAKEKLAQSLKGYVSR